MIAPRPCACMYGMTYLQHRYTLVRLTSCTRRHASRPVDRIESSSGGEMPAVLKAMSTEPYACWAKEYIPRTSSSSVTAARTNSPPTSSATPFPVVSSTSATPTRAPSSARRRAVASPMPLAPPVMTATRSCRRCIDPPNSGDVGDEDILGLGERTERVRAQLAAEARLLEATERRPVADRGVGVDRQVARLHRTRQPQRASHVPGPDRARQPVRGVVGDPHGVGLVLERQHAPHRAEDLLVPGAPGPGQHGRRKPETRPRGTAPLEGDAGFGEPADLLPVRAADQRPDLGLRGVRIADAHTAHRGFQQFHEPVVRAPLHEHAGAGAAVLPGVVEDRVRRRGGGWSSIRAYGRSSS